MVREQRRVLPIPDADVAGHFQKAEADRNRMVRPAEYRVARVEPALARRGERPASLTDDGAPGDRGQPGGSPAGGGDARRWRQSATTIAGAALAAIATYVAAAPLPPTAVAALGGASMEARVVASTHGQSDKVRAGAERDESDDEPAQADRAQPTDAYDGLYAGTTTMRADGRLVAFRVKVTNGVGSGTQSRLDCGVAPVSLEVSVSGIVSGVVQIFGPTCLKTNLAIRGRAIGGALLLRLGSQYLELSKPGD